MACHDPGDALTHGATGVADEDWIYATTFRIDCLEELKNGTRLANIVFEGLDTFCTVYLVGNIRSEYCFHTHGIKER